MLLGFDKSRWNPDVAPPPGYRFMAVRLSSGMSLDPMADEHIARSRDNGIDTIIGYHYLTTGPKAAPAADQAALFLERADYFGQLGLANDVEPLDWAHRDPAWRVRSWAIDFADCVSETAGRPCGTYIAKNEADRIQLYDEFAARSWLWLADYQPPIDIPKPWSRLTILQTGVKAGLDQDRFDGTLGELRAVLGLDAAPLGCVFPGDG